MVLDAFGVLFCDLDYFFFLDDVLAAKLQWGRLSRWKEGWVVWFAVSNLQGKAWMLPCLTA